VSIVSRKLKFKFRLYIAKGTPNSAQALVNLDSFCRMHLPDRHEIEVVDVISDPQHALADDIRMTPTLLKISPPPARRIVGTLSQTQRILDTLGLIVKV
jgi:circadian clock protein KaiB